MTFENVAMLLPGRRVATGTLITEGESIAEIREHPLAAGVPARAVLPGIVNCHGHTAMTLLRGVGAGLPLQRWLEEAIFPVEAKMTPADVRAGVRWGVMEMFAGGTTAVVDMYDFPADCEAVFAAAGMRARVCRVGLSFVPGRLDDAAAFTRGGSEGLVRRDWCIHSEYLTDEPYCRALAAAMREYPRPLNFHLSETRREHEECIARHGRTPLEYLDSLGLLDCGGYAAHCVWCTDDDFRLMAAKGITLVHNPTSNLKLGSGAARIARALELGVNVTLGTDGCASNDNLNMFEEMQLAALLPKGLAADPTQVSPWEVIEMATVNGARALGMESQTGSLAVGKAADLCVVDLSRPHLCPVHDLPALVVYSMQASDVVLTMVAGRVVYDHGRYPTVDAEAARTDFLAAVGRLSR